MELTVPNMWKCKLKIILPFLFCLIQNGSGFSRIDPLVDTPVGLIRGLRATDGDYSMFLGIPYAIVNKNKPFGPPLPQPRFEVPYEAYDDSLICPQVHDMTFVPSGTLDCLNLNVYVPNSASSTNRLPVMVWVHGGGFTYHNAERSLYGPRYLVRKDVILVTFNYRLGIYGFMCLDTPNVPGNQGLKDQRLALKWVKDNIESFGGDSDKITLFGQSAGGSAVDHHLIYGQEKLFDNVILQSGTALSPFGVVEPDRLLPIKLSEHLGFTTTDIEEALNFLATVDTNRLVTLTVVELNLDFRPCVEKAFDNVENFIHDHPVNIETPSIGNTPLLLGYTSAETLEMYAPMTPEQFETVNVFYERLALYFTFDDKRLAEMEALVRHFYIGEENISEQVKEGLIKFHGDFYFNYPTVRALQNYLKNGATNIYYYVFFYEGDTNFLKTRLNITDPGAAHADELGYLFNIQELGEPTPEDEIIIDRITTLWANFARYGNPTPETTELLPVQLPAITSSSQYYLAIDSELKVGRRNYYSRMTFWDLFYKLNEKYQSGYVESDRAIRNVTDGY